MAKKKYRFVLRSGNLEFFTKPIKMTYEEMQKTTDNLVSNNTTIGVAVHRVEVEKKWETA